MTFSQFFFACFQPNFLFLHNCKLFCNNFGSYLTDVIFHASSRCAQKIVTQLETVPLLGKSTNHFRYEKLSEPDKEKKKYDRKYASYTSPSDSKNSRERSSERDDNKKNELVEKQLELKEKQQKSQQVNSKTDSKKTNNEKTSKRDSSKDEKNKKDKKKS